MVPVNIFYFESYYKQKIGRVMKIIYIPFIFGFCCVNAFAAGAPAYLSQVGTAWASVLGEVGVSGEVASFVQNAQTGNASTFNNLLSILAYNDTPMMIFEANNHTDMAFYDIKSPLSARRSACHGNLQDCDTKSQHLIVEGRVFANFADYTSDLNGDFKVNNTGGSVFVKGYITDGWVIGAGYTRNLLDTEDNWVYTDATGNSITLLSQYLSKWGMFVNFGVNGGHISWDTDKTIIGVLDDSSYDTEFLSGMLTGGIHISRNWFSMTPKASIKYLIMGADEYTDAAAQSFDKWWYNNLTGDLGIDFSFDIKGKDFLFSPTISLGGKYDFISKGSNDVNVSLINNAVYRIPLDIPSRAGFYGGLGAYVYAGNFYAGLSYKLEVRENYYNHNALLDINIRF